jgi:pimeloyl-ACP methyl ester carboxylesterase
MDRMGPELGEMLKQTPLYQVYSRVAPRPQDWPRLVARIAEWLHTDYDWSRDVAAITAPTLLIFGDRDGARLSHIGLFLELLPDGQLAVLPDKTHLTIFSPALVPLVNDFLDAPCAD